MTGRHATARRGSPAGDGRRARRLGLDLAGVPGRARTDAWPLVLTVLVVALGVGLAALAPRFAARTERDAVAAAVTAAGERAEVVVSHDLDQLLRSAGPRDGVVEQVGRLAEGLDASVAEALPGVGPRGVRTIASRSLPLTDVTDARGETTVRFVHLWSDGGPAVTWVAGRAPDRAGGAGGPDGAGGEVRLVEVGLSEAVAELLRLGPGDALPGPGVTNGPTEVRVAGVFRADDPADPAWATAPEVLTPAPRGDEVVLSTSLAVLCTDGCLPDALDALPAGTFSVAYTYRADPQAVAEAGADVVRRAAGAAVGNPGVLATSMFSEVRTELPEALAEVTDRVGAARAQAGVLVAAVGAGSVLTIALAAALLAARRTATLGQHRSRGGSLAAVAVELLAESVPVAALGAALGVAVAAVVLPGPVPWATAGPVVLAAVLASPALGVRVAARAAGGRRPAAARQRPASARDAALRRGAAELAVLVAAAGAVATAQAREVADGGLAIALAPVLLAVAGALAVFRAVPWLLRAAVVLAGRSRHAVPVLAAGRARAATRGLPFVALAAVVALGSFAALLGTTVEGGRVQASWDAVGADVTATVARPDPAVAEAAARLAGAPGVELAVAVRLQDLRFRSTWGAVPARLVAVGVDDLAALADLTPVGGEDVRRGVPALRSGAGSPGVPALVSDDLLEHSSENLGVQWGGSWVPVTAVGRAPVLDGRRDGLVVVDLGALDEAVASDVAPSALWAVGDGAADAVRAAPELSGGDVVDRAGWLADRRGDPLVSALTVLTLAAAALLAALAALVVVLGAAGGAPDRARTLATLRAVGVAGRQSWRIAVGELLPPALLATVVGVALGGWTARLLGSALDLRSVTGQARDPVLVVPWWLGAPVVLVAVVVAATVAVEASARRRERLGQVLRMGTPA